jgi:hypothetical protein
MDPSSPPPDADNDDDDFVGGPSSPPPWPPSPSLPPRPPSPSPPRAGLGVIRLLQHRAKEKNRPHPAHQLEPWPQEAEDY